MTLATHVVRLPPYVLPAALALLLALFVAGAWALWQLAKED